MRLYTLAYPRCPAFPTLPLLLLSILQPLNMPEALQDRPSEDPEKAHSENDNRTERSTRNSTSDEHSGPPPSRLGEIVFIAIVCSAHLMTQAGLALSVVPMHIIGDSFGIDNLG